MLFKIKPKIFKYKNIRWLMDFIDEDGETANAYIFTCVPALLNLPCAHKIEANRDKGYDIACDTWRVESFFERSTGTWIRGQDRYQDGAYTPTMDGRISKTTPPEIKALSKALMNCCESLPLKKEARNDY